LQLAVIVYLIMSNVQIQNLVIETGTILDLVAIFADIWFQHMLQLITKNTTYECFIILL